MKKIVKTLTILGMCCLCVGLVACDNDNKGVMPNIISAERPIYQPGMEEVGETQKSPKDYKLSANGNFSSIKGIKEYTLDQALPNVFGPSSGVKVTATGDGASFYYTNIIDLNEQTGNLIEFEVLRNTQDSSRPYSNISRVEVTLIDAYDASNTVTVVWKENASWPTSSYMLVSCNGAEFGRKNDSIADNYQPNQSRPKTGTVLHTNGFAETIYTPQGVRMTHLPFSFRYDIAKNQVFANPQKASEEYMILDVDAAEYMKQYPLFRGFTTGEVYLKVTVADLSEQGELIITQINGRDLSGSELETIPNDNLIGLEMDYDYYRNALPSGVVGVGYKLPVPTAYDEIMGKYDVGTSVLFGEQDCSSMINNGVFVPEQAGKYSLVYTAVDANGLSVSRVFDLQVNEGRKEISMDLVEAPNEGYQLFSWISAPLVEIKGGDGKLVDQTVQYLFNGEKVTLNQDGKFYASSLGKLEIVATAQDELGQIKTEAFTKEIKGVTNLSLHAYVPYGLEKGISYVIPDFDAVDYTTGALREMAKSVYVNGEQKQVGDVVKMDGLDALTIDFYGDKGSAAEIVKSYTIQHIAGAKSADMSGVFVTEGVSITQDPYIQATIHSADNVIKMPYALSADFVNVRLSAVNEGMDYDYMDVLMEDSLSGQCVRVRFLLEDGVTYLVVDGKDGSSIKYELPVKMENGDYLEFYYNNESLTVLNSKYEKIADVAYDVNGEPFIGFASAAIKLSVRAGKVNGEAPNGCINIHSICNQSFSYVSYAYGDTVAPELSFATSLPNRTRTGYNTDFVLSKAFVFDVLQYESTMEYAIYSPSGKVVYKGIAEGYTLRLAELGSYRVVYTVKDSWDNSRKYEYYIEAVDCVAPTITVNGEYKAEYRVGEAIKPLAVTVQDDYSQVSQINVKVFVIDTERLLTEVTDSEYMFTKQGYYTVMYYATDEAGNSAIELIEVFAW